MPVAALALTSILGAVATACALWPMLGPVAVAIAPVGGSLAALSLGLLLAFRSHDADVIDELVGQLRSVLPPDADQEADQRKVG